MSVPCQTKPARTPILDARHRERCVHVVGTPRRLGTATAEEPGNGSEPDESCLHRDTSVVETMVFHEGFPPVIKV